KIQIQENGIAVTISNFSLSDTLDCGQCFRFFTQDGVTFYGSHQNHFLTVSQQGNTVFFHNIDRAEFHAVWRNFFDFDTDYAAVKSILQKDPTLALACEYAGGIRILRQDPWEALCSFIISQNNNIPRIKGIIERLCEQFGTPHSMGFQFPSPNRIAALSLEDLSVLRAGFRTKYILDAAQKIAKGQLSLDAIASMPIDQARICLQTINGVGPKVAECALLFGFHRVDAFPIDTWIKKVLHCYYQEGFPAFATPYGGIAQQFLFHYVRHHSLPNNA
ncbi:MAG: DNA glycosylase, partial [Oscillospiraceae bacterium]